MSAAAVAPREFHCPRWPGCQCPDGTVAAVCPGRTLTIDAHEAMAREQAEAMERERSLVLPGNAAANEAMAREHAAATATAMDLEERVAGDYRAFTREKAEQQALSRLVAENDERQRLLARAEASRRGRTISGETLIADINALLIRCERGLTELNAIHTELTMIRNDMAQLHGLPKA